MCGICGCIGSLNDQISEGEIHNMLTALGHRGPDGSGSYANGNVGLGHSRLAIIDLEGGHQPLTSNSGHVTLVFNGEIYNYRDLKHELEASGVVFKTHSDTEVILQLYLRYGINFLQRLRGMFAFALFDKQAKKVFLVRDRFGIKPLYFHKLNGRTYFASEVKPLIQIGYSVEANPDAVSYFVQTRIPHTDETIFKNVFRVPEGHYLEIGANLFEIRQWYKNPRLDTEGSKLNDFELQQAFEEKFEDAVKAEMTADVPVGIFLSGGIDSTVLASEMVRHTDHKVQSFCVDFSQGYSENSIAEETAKSLGMQHSTVELRAEHILELPNIVRALEEPIGDPIIIAQYVLSRATREARVKTVLTGDAADEVLCGYPFLAANRKALKWGRHLPKFLTTDEVSNLIRKLPLKLIRLLADLPFEVASEARERLAYILPFASEGNAQEIYDALLGLYTNHQLKTVLTNEFSDKIRWTEREYLAGTPNGNSNLDKVLSLQYRKWLPSNMNHRQDRLCMAHSVENRVPFLDVNLVEFLAQVPDHMKIKGAKNKILLRNLGDKRFPKTTSQRKKLPFFFPAEFYIQNKSVREMLLENINPATVKKRGILDPQIVERTYEAAQNGDFLSAKKVFMFVILELWHRSFVDNERL